MKPLRCRVRVGENNRTINFMKLYFPQKVLKSRGHEMTHPPCMVLFCFVLFLKVGLGMALSWVTGFPLPMHFCGAHFPCSICLEPSIPSSSASVDESSPSPPPGTARRSRQHAHSLLIPCFHFHYYISQEMHALANSYWQNF